MEGRLESDQLIGEIGELLFNGYRVSVGRMKVFMVVMAAQQCECD